jgi:hypothetical protein
VPLVREVALLQCVLTKLIDQTKKRRPVSGGVSRFASASGH